MKTPFLKVGIGFAVIGILVTATDEVKWRWEEQDLFKEAQSFRRPKEVPFPSHNPFTKEKFQLGRALFFEKSLSHDGTKSCATCHNPSHQWSDNLPTAEGKHGKKLTRRSPSLWNLAWGENFFWDGRAKTLEEQALGPIQNPDEMALSLGEMVKRLENHSDYPKQFEAAFAAPGITPEKVGMAIATFERTLISPVSKFDLWAQGNKNALTRQELKGFALFVGKGNCVQCHSGWNFTNGSFSDVGVSLGDRGRGAILNDSDADFAFKAPSLRNLEGRSFFLHNGSMNSLDEVIGNYNQGGRIQRPTAQLWLKPLNLSSEETAALVAFLKTLSGQVSPISISGGKSWEKVSRSH